MLSPTALFVYNRPDHTRRAIQSLAACDAAAETDLVVFSDAPRNDAAAPGVTAVRELLAGIEGFRSVDLVIRPANLGCRASIIDGVTTMLRRYGRAIFMEDDLICSRHTLTFLDDCLVRYARQPNIMAACAYSYPAHMMRLPARYNYDIYFSTGFFPWGWASWERAVDAIDWNGPGADALERQPVLKRAFAKVGENLPELLARQQRGELDDWVLPLTYSQFRNHYLTVSPVHSLVDNIGHDGTGLHCHDTRLFRNDVQGAPAPRRFPDAVFVDEEMMAAARAAHSRSLYFRARRRFIDGALKVRDLVRQIGLNPPVENGRAAPRA